MKDQDVSGEPSTITKKKKPRYWIWIMVVAFAFILVLSWMNRGAPILEVPPGRFQYMVSNRAVRKIVLVQNEMMVELTLKPAALKNPVYRIELEKINSPFGIEPNGPHYMMRIASVDRFYHDYDEATRNIPRDQVVDVQVEQRVDIAGMLINWLFLGFLIFIIVMVIRFFVRR